ncbi:unnamed protein product [Paramecium octaurelia]|uniref:Uncharacterized protein n=1 Tax=Paramecium octaurelia TaxID=43137 RepID=A0A8S1VQE6_PAROT|nr:unnamed protein product [Paramecium octaurelia]
MQNYINSSLLAQRQLIKYIEMKKSPFSQLCVKFAEVRVLNEFERFMEVSKTLSHLFDCRPSDLQYEIAQIEHSESKNVGSQYQNSKREDLVSEPDNYIILDRLDSIWMFMQYLKLKDELIHFSFKFKESEFGLFMGQLDILKSIFKKDIEVKIIQRQGESDTKLHQMRRSYKERKKTQRGQINEKKDMQKYQDQLDTKENSLRLDHTSSQDSTLINLIENSNINSMISQKNKVYQQFGSTFIGDQEFKQLFKKSYLCQSEYEIENRDDVIIFDSTMGNKIELGQCILDVSLRQAIVNEEYKKYYLEMARGKNAIKIYYIDLIGKSYTEFSKNLVFYTNIDVALKEFKGSQDSYLIQFETCSEFQFTQMSNQQVKLQQSNRVIPLIIITNQI